MGSGIWVLVYGFWYLGSGLWLLVYRFSGSFFFRCVSKQLRCVGHDLHGEIAVRLRLGASKQAASRAAAFWKARPVILSVYEEKVRNRQRFKQTSKIKV